MRKLGVFFVLIVLLVPFGASGQQSSSTSDTQFSPEPTVTQYTLPPDKLAQSTALYHTRITLLIAGSLWSLLVLLGILRWHVAARFRDWARAVSRFRFVQAWIFVPLLLLTMAVFDLPFDMYSHHVSFQYGMSVQHWGSWFGDWAKGQLVVYVLGAILLWLMYLIIRVSPRRCWFYFWIIFQLFTLFVVFIAPTVIDPMFNKFVPLEKTQPALVEQISRVTKRAGMNIPPNRMFEMKASEKVTTYNAYVTGFGSTKRVVVWDNTAKDLTTGETLFVFGHEMGHYVLNHIWKGLAFEAVLTLPLFYLVFSIVTHMIQRWGGKLAIPNLQDWASLPLIFVVAGVITFLASPATSGYSRHIEHEADIYGLEVIHGLVPDSNKAAAASFQKLGEKSLSYPDPNPLLVFWTYDHPDIASRVKFAVQYRPWDVGQAPQFVK